MAAILGRTLNELRRESEKADFAAFRAEQVFNWIYKNLKLSPSEMKNLPGDYQCFLEEEYDLNLLELQEKSVAGDRTVKFLWGTDDGDNLESVLLPQSQERRFTACISSQIGCNVGCNFCATGLDGKSRDLEAAEIVEQVWQMAKYLNSEDKGLIRNIVYMGMGEPFLNYREVKKSLEIFISREGFDFGRRRITVSTVGIIPIIEEFARDFPQVGLAISLHSADVDKRSNLVPVNKKYSLPQLKESLREYNEMTGRRVTLEYILLEGENDSRDDAEALAQFCQGLKSHVNIISANPVPRLDIKSPEEERLYRFKSWLEELDISATIRKSRGRENEAACGQLRQNRRHDS